MKSIGVLGGGISGLTAAFYLLKSSPSATVTLFEQDRVGGVVQTQLRGSTVYETGPRSIRVAPRCLEILQIAQEVGMPLADVIFSATSSYDAQVFMDGQLHQFFPPGSFRRLRGFVKNPFFLRLALANCFGKPKHPPVDDESLHEFLQKYFRYLTGADKQKILRLVAAFQTGVYGGRSTELSARWCLPFSAMFQEKYGVSAHAGLKSEATDPRVLDLYKKATWGKSNTLNFRYGLSSFIHALFTHLSQNPRFTFVNEQVLSLEESRAKGKVKTQSTSNEFDAVISTVPSYALCGFLKGFEPLTDLAASIEHRSIMTVNLGFSEAHRLKGVGYLIPPDEGYALSGCLFDSSQFPYQGSSVSLMSVTDSISDEEAFVAQIIKEFYEQTQVKTQHSLEIPTFWKHVLPQYNVGHYLKVKAVEEHSPPWLNVAGQSFYLSGLPNCVLYAKAAAQRALATALN